MNTIAHMAVANQLITFKPIEFDGFRTSGLWAKFSRPGLNPLEFVRIKTEVGQMRTLLAEPNLKRLKA